LSAPRHAELLEWYRKLIAIRRDKVVLPRESSADPAKAVTNFDAEAGWLTFVHNGVLAVFNFADLAQTVPRPGGEWKLVLGSDVTEAQTSDAMSPRSTLIYIGE
jgi:Domain of unknown function (DUF3459)